MKNTWKSLLAAGAMTLSLTSSVFAATPTALTDINNSYAKDQITKLYNAGIISGDEQHHYNPTGTMTRQQLAIVLSKALGLTPDASAAGSYTDVAAWAKPYVGALVKAGIASGYDAKTFGGNDPVTREQLAIFFVRAFGATDLTHELGLVNTDFTDDEQIDGYAIPDVALMEKLGFLNGTPTQYGPAFNPKGKADRQAVAHLVSEFTFNKDTYTAKLGNIQEILAFMKPTEQAMRSIQSVSLTNTEVSTPPSEYFPPFTEKLDVTLSPFTAHGTIQIGSDPTNKSVYTSSEWYIENGIMYYPAAQAGTWYKLDITNDLNDMSDSITRSIRGEDMWSDYGAAADCTLTSDANSDTLVRNMPGVFGTDEKGNPIDSSMSNTYVIDKQTHLVTSDSFVIKGQNGMDTNQITYDHINSLQPIVVPATIKDTAVEPDLTHANNPDPAQEIQLFQQFLYR